MTVAIRYEHRQSEFGGGEHRLSAHCAMANAGLRLSIDYQSFWFSLESPDPLKVVRFS